MKRARTTVGPVAAYCPSHVHQRMMRELPPQLSYRGGDVAGWQSRLRRKLRSLTGFDQMPRHKCPLKPRTLWQRSHAQGTIEKIVITTEPGADAPCYLALPDPKNFPPPWPVFICLQGHSTGMHNSIAVSMEDETVPIKPPGDRDFAIGCIRRGIASLCIEQRAFGERREQFIGNQIGQRTTCHQATVNALLLGRTLIVERVYDVDRGIDLLAERQRQQKLFDMRRLGVMGNSGGGTASLFAAALLPRLQLAMPSCYFCTFRDSIGAIHHCVDNYIPGILRYAEMADIAGLFAPRPIVMVAGRKDDIFPLAGVKEAFANLQRIYRAAGAPHHCQLVVGSGGHRFYAASAWKTMGRFLG